MKYNQFFDDELSYESKQYYKWSKSNYTEWIIKWNEKGISGKENANGYIVQLMNMYSDFYMVHIEDCDYYEAWRVENGSVVQGQYNYDDKWATICLELLEKDDIQRIDQSLNGTVRYNSKVYWIPFESEDYINVDKWVCEVGAAGNLKSTYNIDFDISRYFRFDRFREWDCKKIALDYYDRKTKVL